MEDIIQCYITGKDKVRIQTQAFLSKPKFLPLHFTTTLQRQKHFPWELCLYIILWKLIHGFRIQTQNYTEKFPSRQQKVLVLSLFF